LREVSLITNRIYIKKRVLAALSESILTSTPKELQNPERGEIVEWN
jgi:hypothetical protein